MRTEREIERDARDTKFWSLHRLVQALWEDEMRPVELALGLIGFMLKGALMLLGYMTFPPVDVQFLLRTLPVFPLTEARLGWLLLLLGVAMVLAVGTCCRWLRGLIAIVAGAVTLIITIAYIFADVAPYFQAWVGYLGLSIILAWVSYRNFRDEAQDEKARTQVEAELSRRGAQ
jgi:hypothetical protein